MLKYAATSACLFCVILVLTGCPLETQNSIDNGSYTVPAFMTGKWTEVTRTGAKKAAYNVQPDKASKSKFRAYTLDSTGKGAAKFHDVVMSSIAGKIYVNVYQPADDITDDAGWYLLEFHKVNDREFILTGLKANTINADAAPAEIVRFLTKNKEMTDIFDSSEEYHYKKE